jgi:hypothetical protein
MCILISGACILLMLVIAAIFVTIKRKKINEKFAAFHRGSGLERKRNGRKIILYFALS